MKILVTTNHDSLYEHDAPTSSATLGRLIQPRHYSRIEDTAAAGWAWGADNDGFGGWTDDKAAAFTKMLDRIAGLPGCRFVAAPDVVGDAEATSVLFDEWHSQIVDRDLPVALVAQDGIENVDVPWDRIDALFIGGSDDFKLGPVAADFARQASDRGLWVHWGRVNTRKRIRYIAATRAADSFDGSSWAKFRKAFVDKARTLRKLDQGIRWAREAVAEVRS